MSISLKFVVCIYEITATVEAAAAETSTTLVQLDEQSLCGVMCCDGMCVSAQ